MKWSNKRWKAVISYVPLEGAGIHEDDIFYIEEIEELQDIIEKGVDWNFIAEIKITYQRKR